MRVEGVPICRCREEEAGGSRRTRSLIHKQAGKLENSKNIRTGDLKTNMRLQKTMDHTRVKYVPGKTGCPAEWTRFGSSCYFFSAESKSWDEAREFCRAREADLMVINTNDEKTFLVAFRDKPVWIGLTDKVQEGTWKWVDGSPLTLFWGKNQPSDGGGKIHGEEDCAEIRETLGYWNDLACGTSLRWICEKEATLFV
uniref:C-type lectin domain-containing protein n=1 Tax=Oryzias latipes TaxID=8090 RepID=A0A3P9MCG5_ORYLA